MLFISSKIFFDNATEASAVSKSYAAIYTECDKDLLLTLRDVS
jgi:hypothetical protein